MRCKCFLKMACVVAAVLIFACAGSSQAFAVGREDFKLVNQYLEETKWEPMRMDTAEDLDRYLYQHEQTRDITTMWKLIVGYVQNEAADVPCELDYSIEFSEGSFEFKTQSWEYIGY